MAGVIIAVACDIAGAHRIGQMLLPWLSCGAVLILLLVWCVNILALGAVHLDRGGAMFEIAFKLPFAWLYSLLIALSVAVAMAFVGAIVWTAWVSLSS